MVPSENALFVLFHSLRWHRILPDTANLELTVMKSNLCKAGPILCPAPWTMITISDPVNALHFAIQV